MVKLIVYDLDGTLIDSAKVVSSVLNQMRAEAGLQHLTIEQLIPWLSMGGEDLVANALEIQVEEVQPHLLEFRKRYSELATPVDSLYPGIQQSLQDLSSAGYQLAVCTNKPRALAEKVLKETKLHNLFGYINAGGDLPNKKPHPDTLLTCLNFFGVDASDAVLVGDSTVDQRLSQATNVAFVQYLPGYDDGIKLADAWMRIDHHAKLVNLLADLSKQGNS
jgi:phosphoglycolate phosphatase